MSNLSDVAIQQFNHAFTNEFEANGILGMGRTTQMVTGVRGDAYKWSVQGTGVIPLRGGYGSPVPVMDLDYSRVTTTFEDYAGSLPVDEHEQAQLEINAMGQLPMKLGKMMARREDQIIIDTFDGTTVPAANDIAHNSQNMTLDKIKEMAAAFDDAEVPSEDRFLLITPSQRDALLSDDKVLSILYVNNKNMLTGNVEQLIGFNILVMGSRSEGGLSVSSNIRKCWAWQKSAAGIVYSIMPKVQVEYRQVNLSNVATANMRCGASTLLPAGLGVIYCDES